MNAITSLKEDLRKELTENFRMDKMQNEVKATQAITSQEVMAKISKKVTTSNTKATRTSLISTQRWKTTWKP